MKLDNPNLILLIIVLAGCRPVPIGSNYGGPLSQPEAARIDVPAEPLTRFDRESRDILFRYLAGNPRWEIRQGRGLKYAVRREKVDGKYETTLNGFYSGYDGGTFWQTRVLIAFDKPYSFGLDRGNITRARPGAKDVAVIIEGTHAGTPGQSSYVIIEGDHINLEIYDQSPEVERQFTTTAIAEVCAELTDVLKHRDEIAETGIMPVESHYPGERPDAAHFNVTDGMQPGIYLLNAAVNPKAPGSVYARVYEVESGQRLSDSRVKQRSIRYVGWSQEGRTFFPYNAEVTVYEGDWDSTYEARFELWHVPEQGEESKIAETTRMINGWER